MKKVEKVRTRPPPAAAPPPSACSRCQAGRLSYLETPSRFPQKCAKLADGRLIKDEAYGNSEHGSQRRQRALVAAVTFTQNRVYLMKGAFIITLSSSSSSSASMFFFFLSMSESIVHRIVSVANISKSNQQQRLYTWFFYNRVQRWVAFILTGGWPSHLRACGL